jgi:hypothetical protein
MSPHTRPRMDLCGSNDQGRGGPGHVPDKVQFFASASDLPHRQPRRFVFSAGSYRAYLVVPRDYHAR